MTTLRERLNLVKNKIETTEAAEKAKKDNPKPPTFFERHLPGLRSGETQRNYETAKTLANTRATAFINSVRSVVHPDHDSNVHKFFSEYGGDYGKINKAFLETASAELDYPNPEDCKQDTNYEARVAKENAPKAGASHDTHAFYDILMQNLQESRDRRGYGPHRVYDGAVISNWKSKYHQD